MAPSDVDRLAAAARSRRRELGLALNDANATAGGVAKGTWQRVEKGLPIRPSSYEKIDRLLRWAPGSTLGTLNGGDPVPAEASTADADTTISTLSPEQHEAEARGVIQLAVLATTDGLTSEQIRALSDRAVRDLREAGLI